MKALFSAGFPRVVLHPSRTFFVKDGAVRRQFATMVPVVCLRIKEDTHAEDHP